MKKKYHRCQQWLSESKKCQNVALEDGYCRLHKDGEVDMAFWQKQDEVKRLSYLQVLAEVRAMNAHKGENGGNKENDLIFNRNLRIAAAISRLRHGLEPKEKGGDDWLTVLQAGEAYGET